MICPLTFTHYLRFLASCKGTCFLTQGGAIFKATVGFLHEFTGLTVEHSQLPEKKSPKNPWRVGDGVRLELFDLSHNLYNSSKKKKISQVGERAQVT